MRKKIHVYHNCSDKKIEGQIQVAKGFTHIVSQMIVHCISLISSDYTVSDQAVSLEFNTIKLGVIPKIRIKNRHFTCRIFSHGHKFAYTCNFEAKWLEYWK